MLIHIVVKIAVNRSHRQAIFISICLSKRFIIIHTGDIYPVWINLIVVKYAVSHSERKALLGNIF